MCTVSFLPTRTGFALAMNRDEQKLRPCGLPPQQRLAGRYACLYPSEPTGGTWISINGAAIALALINWYEKPRREAADMLTRGTVIKQLQSAGSLFHARTLLTLLPLSRINPFRLIAISLPERAIYEWRWDGALLETRRYGWKRHHWFSSGFDEPQARRERAKVVAAAAKSHSARTPAWLRRLHQSHQPERGPFSICMHRDEAETVSYTEIVATSRQVRMSYLAGSPCSGRPVASSFLRFCRRASFQDKK